MDSMFSIYGVELISSGFMLDYIVQILTGRPAVKAFLIASNADSCGARRRAVNARTLFNFQLDKTNSITHAIPRKFQSTCIIPLER